MNNVWYNVVLYPQDYEWHGVKHACEVLDAMQNTPPVFSSQSKTKARAEARRWSKRGRMAEIFETDWNPALRIEWVYRPDPQKAVQALREAIR
jgi:hypothetical protein